MGAPVGGFATAQHQAGQLPTPVVASPSVAVAAVGRSERPAIQGPQPPARPSMTYPSTTTILPQRLNAALVILRIVVGAIFIAHGAQKLFVFGLAGVVGAFGQMGVPLPAVTGPAIAFLEFFGGIAVVLGLFTRPLGLLLAADMLGAIALVKISKGLVGGYEFELSLLGIALALALAGAGEYSLDRVLAARKDERRRHG